MTFGWKEVLNAQDIIMHILQKEQATMTNSEIAKRCRIQRDVVSCAMIDLRKRGLLDLHIHCNGDIRAMLTRKRRR